MSVAVELPRQDVLGRRIAPVVLGLMYKVIGFILFVELMAMAFDVIAGVISRYVFNSSFSWTEEIAIWLLISLTFTGMALGHVANRHITIDLIDNARLPPWLVQVRLFTVDAIVALVTVFILSGGTQILETVSGESVTLGWDIHIKYATIPIACVISFILAFLAAFTRGNSALRSAMPAVVAVLIYFAITYTGSPNLGTNAAFLMWGVFGFGLLLGVPIAYAMAFAGFFAGWGGGILPIGGVVSAMIQGASSFVFLAIPFFLTAGYLMNSGGLSERLIDFANALVGHFHGGLAQANVVHSVMLGGVCGSSNADAASTTKILVPQMIARGYSPAFACGVTAVGSILPACFPPSIALLIYASVSGVSVARLFTAGIVPGLLLCAVMMIVVHVIAKRRNYERAPARAPLRTMAWAGMRAVPALFIAVVIVGLLRAGVMTATEVGTIAALWAFVFGKFVYRGFTMREFYHDMVECALDTALVCFIAAVAFPFARVMVIEQLPQEMVNWVISHVGHLWEMFLVVNLIAFVAGCVLEIAPSIFVLAPLLSPLLAKMGVDPVHGAIIIMLNLILSTASPPMGCLVFTCSSISKVPTGQIFRECIPFVIACYSVLILVTFVPAVSLTLWNLIGN